MSSTFCGAKNNVYKIENLNQHFPSISELLQEKLKMTAKKVAIQIVHCAQRNLWVTASTKWCTNCDMKVYDSVFNKLDKNTLEICLGLK